MIDLELAWFLIFFLDRGGVCYCSSMLVVVHHVSFDNHRTAGNHRGNTGLKRGELFYIIAYKYGNDIIND